MYTKITNISRPIKIISFLWIVLLAPFSTNLFAEEPRLLFNSSFDDSVYIDRSSIYFKIKGEDKTTGYDWYKDLPGTKWFSNFLINSNNLSTYQDYVEFKIENVTGHDGKPTNAIYSEFKKDDPSWTSLTRASWYLYTDESVPKTDHINRLREMYWTVWVKIDLKKTGTDWSLPWEWKANDKGYRWGLYIGWKDDKPYWHLQSQWGTENSPDDDFNYYDYDNGPKFSEWQKWEAHWKWDKEDGYVKIAIDDKVIFNHKGRTARYDDQLFYIMPFKIYGTQGKSWRTDFQIWDKPPSSSILSDNYIPGSDPVVAPVADDPALEPTNKGPWIIDTNSKELK